MALYSKMEHCTENQVYLVFIGTATDNYRLKLLKVQRQRQKEGMICYESDEEINKNAVLLEFLSLNRLLVGHTVIKLPFLTISATDACLLTLDIRFFLLLILINKSTIQSETKIFYFNTTNTNDERII